MIELLNLSNEEKNIIKDALFDKAMNIDKVLKIPRSYEKRLRETQKECLKLIEKLG